MYISLSARSDVSFAAADDTNLTRNLIDSDIGHETVSLAHFCANFAVHRFSLARISTIPAFHVFSRARAGGTGSRCFATERRKCS